MPTEDLVLSWEEISFAVPVANSVRDKLPCSGSKTGSKTILHYVDGSVKSSQCMAVMGSSGAGKTTFLNILAQQIQRGGGKQGGFVKINGEVMGKHLFRKYCGYVKQDDVLLPNLTVRETIDFYADLRLPSALSRAEKKARVIIIIPPKSFY